MADKIPVGIEFKTVGAEKAQASLDAVAAKGQAADAALGKVEQSSKGAGKSLDGLGASAQQAAGNTEKLAGSANTLDKAFAAGKLAIGGFIAAFGARQLISIAQSFISTADAVTNLNSQLLLATGSATQAATAYAGLLRVAQTARVDFVELGNTYAQVARATQSLGLSGTQTLRITESLAKAITISGASASAARSSMIQLAQGLSSGVLRGDELNSVMEQTPRVARALADGLGVPIGKLRELGAAGALTGDLVAQALLKASDAIDSEFNKSAVTAGQAVTVLGNSVTNLIGVLNDQLGASNAVARGFMDLAGAIDTVTAALQRNKEETGSVTELGRIVDAIRYRISSEFKAQVDAAQLARDVAPNEAITERRAAEARAATEAARAMQEAVDKFVNARNNLTREQTKQAEQNKLLTEFSAAVKGYANDSAEYLRAFKALQTGLANIDTKFAPKGTGVRSAAAAAERERLQELKQLSAAIAEADGLTADYGDTLGRYQKYLADTLVTEEQYVALVERLIARQPIARDLAKEAADAEKQRVATIAGIVQIQTQADNADAKRVQSLAEEVAALRLSNDEIGLSADALGRLMLQRMDDAISMKEHELLIRQSSDARSESIALLEDEIRLMRERRAETAVRLDRQAEVVARDAAKRSAEEAAEQWRRAAQQIETSITDALMRGFESGKGFAQNLVDTIKNMFRTLVLRPVVQAIVAPVAGALTGLFGTGANAAQSVSGAAGIFNAGSSIYNTFGLGAGLQSAAYAASIPGLASFGAGSQAAMLASQTSVFGAQGAAMTAAAGGAATTATASILSTAASVLPWIGLGLAVYSLFSKGGGAKTGGAFVSAPTLARLYTPSDRDLDAAQLAGAAVAQYQATLTRFGGTAANVDYGFGFDLDPRGTAQSRASFQVGDLISTMDVGRTEAELQAGITDALGRMVVAGLQASDLPPAIADVFSQIDVRSASAEQIAAAMAAAEATSQVLTALERLGVPMREVSSAMIAAGGGAEQFAQSLGTYFQQFYGEAERAEIATAALQEQFAALGLAMPATREQFRAVVESLYASGDGGRETAAAMVGLAGAFAELVPATEGAMESVRRLVATQAEVDSYWKAVLSSSEFASRELDTLRGRFDALGVTMPDTLAKFRTLVEGMDTSTDAGKSLQIAIGLLAGDFTRLVESADQAAGAVNGIKTAFDRIADNEALAGFYSTVLPESQQLTDLLQDLLSASFAEFELPVPQTAQEYIDTLAGITSDEQRAAVMGLAGAWARLRPVIEGSVDAVQAAVVAFSQLYNSRRGLFSTTELIGQASQFLTEQFTALGTAVPKTRTAFVELLTAAAGTETEQRLDALLPLWLDMIGMQEALAAEAQRAADAQREAARRAAQAAIDEANRMAQRIRDALAGVGEFVESLFTSGDLLGITPAQQLAAAQDIFGQVLGQAQGGDVEAIQRLPSIARDVLEAATAMFAHTDQFLAIRDEILAQLAELTGTRLPDTGTPISTTGRLDNLDLTAYQQRGQQIEILHSMDRRLARLESRRDFIEARG